MDAVGPRDDDILPDSLEDSIVKAAEVRDRLKPELVLVKNIDGLNATDATAHGPDWGPKSRRHLPYIRRRVPRPFATETADASLKSSFRSSGIRYPVHFSRKRATSSAGGA